MAKPTKPRLQVGVVGVGMLGAQHARIAAQHPDVELKAVVDPRKPVGTAVARETGARWYGDYGSMLKQEELDTVIVATPDPLHRDPAVAAARAGVSHIITEKPMATSLAVPTPASIITG